MFIVTALRIPYLSMQLTIDNRILTVFNSFLHNLFSFGARIAKSVQRQATGWKKKGLIPGRGKRFSLLYVVQIDHGAHPASCPMGIRGFFPGCKATWP
jgi:hypothetical protein